MEKQLTANQYESLLCKPVWDANDVAAFCRSSLPYAYDLIQQLRGPDVQHKKEGWCDMPRRVRRDAVLHHFSTDAKTEMGVAVLSRFVTGFLNMIDKFAETPSDGEPREV